MMALTSLLKKEWRLGILFIITISCETHRNGISQQKHDLPEPSIPAGLDASAKEAFIEQYKKGYQLYSLNCIHCHGPNDQHPVADRFSDTQLTNYTLRGSGEHISVFRNGTITEGELALIVTYLQFRKNSDSR